jgi:hypothetical protein
MPSTPARWSEEFTDEGLMELVGMGDSRATLAARQKRARIKYARKSEMCWLRSPCGGTKPLLSVAFIFLEWTRDGLWFSTVMKIIRSRFAIIEFKRPGAIDWLDWQPAYTKRGFVGNSDRASKICQQLSKYAYSHNVPFVCADRTSVVLFHLERGQEDWLTSTYGPITKFWWIFMDQNEMKRK